MNDRPVLNPDLLGDPVYKGWHEGTHRSCSPQATLDRVMPMLARFGISRIADVTGLDRVGVPVTFVVRPGSRSLAVSQGKGLSLLAAQVSGVMESIETWHAERVEHPLRHASYHDLANEQPTVQVSSLAHSRLKSWNPDARLLWLQAKDLLGGASVWVPYETVHTDYTVPAPTGSGYFCATTNGLASGNHLLEALAHASLEVIERDALTLWRRQQDPAHDVLDLNTVDYPVCAGLIDQLGSADLDIRVWPVTSDVGVPCFEALLVGREAHGTDPEFGSGCHPDKGIALLRALTEAVQARTTFITGSRDDYGHEPYTAVARADRERYCTALLKGPGRQVPWNSIANHPFDTVLEDLQFIAQGLVTIGIQQILWVDLTREDIGIPVVRVLIPGLEGPYKGPDSDYVPGHRALAQSAT